MNRPDWREWKHTPDVTVWQACALSLDIDPYIMLMAVDQRLMNAYLALAFRVIRFDDRQHFLPGENPFHVGKEELALRDPLLRGKVGFRKADLIHWLIPSAATRTLYHAHRQAVRLNQRFFYTASEGDTSDFTT